MFKPNQTFDTRMAVIEEKFTVYEKMMNKLENAIQTISEINQNISKMLILHEEKIDNSSKTDEIIFDKLRRLEEKNTEEHQKVVEKLENLESNIGKSIEEEKNKREKEVSKVADKIADVVKFRWIFAGGLAVVLFIFSNSSIIIDILTPDQTPAKIEKVN